MHHGGLVNQHDGGGHQHQSGLVNQHNRGHQHHATSSSTSSKWAIRLSARIFAVVIWNPVWYLYKGNILIIHNYTSTKSDFILTTCIKSIVNFYICPSQDWDNISAKRKWHSSTLDASPLIMLLLLASSQVLFMKVSSFLPHHSCCWHWASSRSLSSASCSLRSWLTSSSLIRTWVRSSQIKIRTIRGWITKNTLQGKLHANSSQPFCLLTEFVGLLWADA